MQFSSLNLLDEQLLNECEYCRNESTGNWRGVRVSEGKLQPPDGAWSESTVYNVVYPKGHSQGKYNTELIVRSFCRLFPAISISKLGCKFIFVNI